MCKIVHSHSVQVLELGTWQRIYEEEFSRHPSRSNFMQEQSEQYAIF